MLPLGFGPYSNIFIDIMEYLGAGGPVVNSTNLVIKLNLNSYMENIKNRTL